MNSSFPNKWSFSYLKFTICAINIIAEPKYKHRQQEQFHMILEKMDLVFCWPIINTIASKSGASYITVLLNAETK